MDPIQLVWVDEEEVGEERHAGDNFFVFIHIK
jgi:hypothetical protein